MHFSTLIWRNNKFIRPVDCSKMIRSVTVWPIREKGKATVTSFSSKMVEMNLELCSTSYLPGTNGLPLFRSLKRKEASHHQSWMNRIQDDPMVKSFIEKDILGKHFQAVKETFSDICIPCCDIVCRCVFVCSESAGASGYVSPVLKYYQHD